jgi:hypothetical protein
MNNKFNFISDQQVEPTILIAKEQSLYTQITENLEQHYKLRGELSSKWDRIINYPEYTIIEGENCFKIKSSDGLTLATIDSKILAINIETLMNLAYREGSKQIIKVLENL